jgi:hypothetical protein
MLYDHDGAQTGVMWRSGEKTRGVVYFFLVLEFEFGPALVGEAVY